MGQHQWQLANISLLNNNKRLEKNDLDMEARELKRHPEPE